MLYAACADAQPKACSPFATEKPLVSFFLVLGSFFPAEPRDRCARRHRIKCFKSSGEAYRCLARSNVSPANYRFYDFTKPLARGIYIAFLRLGTLDMVKTCQRKLDR
jgi:hypothetical protein